MSPGIDAASHGLWATTACAAPHAPPLDGDTAVDVAIVGAGYTGLSTALHLLEGGAGSVAVLEAAQIGFGASGRNAGLVNAGAWIRPDALLRQLGRPHGPRLLQALGDGPGLVFDLIARHRMDCEPVRSGNLHCAIGAAGLAEIRERARQWRGQGVPVHLLDAGETARLTGTGAYSGALLDPRTGTLQPLGYARGLARAVQSLGGRLYERTAIVDVHPDGAGWRLATAHGPTVRADRIVVATNTVQTAPGRSPDAWPQLQTELARMPYFNAATVPLPSALRSGILAQGHGAWDTATVLSSLRLDAAGRLVYGSVGALTPQTRGTHLQWVGRAIARLFPPLRGIGIDYQWHGWIDTTAGHLPCLHELRPGIWSLSGYNGRGIAAGTMLGRELARMLLGRQQPADMPLPVTAVRPIAGKRLREACYLLGAAAAHAAGRRF